MGIPVLFWRLLLQSVVSAIHRDLAPETNVIAQPVAPTDLHKKETKQHQVGVSAVKKNKARKSECECSKEEQATSGCECSQS